MKKAKLRETLKTMIYHALEIMEDTKALSRDRREPDRREKVTLEMRLRRILLRYFRDQRARLLQAVTAYMPERKAIFDVENWLNMIFGPDDPARSRLQADVMRLVVVGTSAGADIFRRNSGIELDYSLINANAQAAVSEHVGNMLQDIDKATREILKEQVQRFVETPGMTIGDLREALPFSPGRANTIAVTEVTRAYGEGERMAGERLAEEYPDVKVVKKWYTNEDDKVCPLCGPLGRGGWVPIADAFATDSRTGEMIMNPPRHPNCRCWIATRTKING